MIGHENGKLFVGLAGLVVAGLAVGVWPNLRAAERLDNAAADLSSRIERSDDGDAALGRLRVTLEERKQDSQRLLKDIPRDGDVGGFIRDVSDRFGELGLGRPEIKTGRPIENDHAQALPMTVEVNGTFLELMQAIEWVESIDRLVRVRKVSVKSPQGSGRETSFGEPLEGELVLDVYYDAATQSPLADSGEDAS